MKMAPSRSWCMSQALRVLLRHGNHGRHEYLDAAACNGPAAAAFCLQKFHVFSMCKQQGIGAAKWMHGVQSHNFSSKGEMESNFDASEASSDGKASQRDATLHAALTEIGKDVGKNNIKWMGRFFGRRHVPVVSTGSLNLDIALGIGGLPKGRVIEIYGPEGSGKTTLALHVIAEAQKDGGHCVYIDAEHALDQSLAEAVGVNTKNLLFSQPDCGEQALNLVDKFVRSGSVDVIVVDSVAALVPQNELVGELGEDNRASQSILMTRALRQLSSPLSLSQTVLIFLNQVRAKFTRFGGSETTAGGNALKFYASVRLNIRRIGLLKKGNEIVGSQVMVTVVKNKLAHQFSAAEFELEFGRGISSEAEVLDLGCKYGFVTKSGPIYNVNGKHLHGKENAKEYLRENALIHDELFSKLKGKLLDTVDKEWDIEEKLVGSLGGSDNLQSGNTALDFNNDEEIELEVVADV